MSGPSSIVSRSARSARATPPPRLHHRRAVAQHGADALRARPASYSRSSSREEHEPAHRHLPGRRPDPRPGVRVALQPPLVVRGRLPAHHRRQHRVQHRRRKLLGQLLQRLPAAQPGAPRADATPRPPPRRRRRRSRAPAPATGGVGSRSASERRSSSWAVGHGPRAGRSAPSGARSGSGKAASGSYTRRYAAYGTITEDTAEHACSLPGRPTGTPATARASPGQIYAHRRTAHTAARR